MSEMKPITRKEKFIAGEKLTPITREEMFLEKYGGGASGGADWNASEGEAGHVKNRTHYEETTVVNEPLNITWDGNTEGLVQSEGAPLYKVSDLVLTNEQIKLITMTVSDGGTIAMANLFDQLASAGFVTEELLIAERFAFCRKDGASFASFVFPKKGIYLSWGEGMNNIVSLTTTEPIEHTKTVVKKLDKKFLPDDVGGGTSIDVTAEVGQTIIVKEVDANGTPTKWESAEYQPRTHYAEVIEKELLAESTVEFTEENEGSALLNDTFSAGDTYRVIWNGTEYTGTAVIMSDMVVGGNLSLFDENLEGYTEPFAIVSGEGVGFVLTFDIPCTAVVGVKVIKEEVHMIPKKFVPFHSYVITDVSDGVVNESYDNFSDILWNGGAVYVRKTADGAQVSMYMVVTASFNNGQWTLVCYNAGTTEAFLAKNGTWTPPTV